MMLKSLNGLAPVYLQDLFSERHTDYDVRDSLRKLNLPKSRTNYLRRNLPDVGVTSGQKPCTKIIYVVLQTSVGLF